MGDRTTVSEHETSAPIMQVKVQTYINLGPGIFRGYRDGLDKLEAGPQLTISGEDENIIAEAVFAVGNRMGADDNGQRWPSGVRSISVGDVITVGEAAMACESFGWRFILEADVIRQSIQNGEIDTRWDND